MRPPETATGCAVSPVVPLPNWPASSPPQQYAVLSAARAQVCSTPPLTVRNRRPPDTAIGVRLQGSLPVEMTQVSLGRLPSCPLLLFPQQYARPLVARAQVCCPPLLIDANTWLVVTARGR